MLSHSEIEDDVVEAILSKIEENIRGDPFMRKEEFW